MKNWLIVAFATLLSFSALASERATEAWSLINDGAVLIDVRTTDEFLAGHIPNAHHLEYNTISTTIGKLHIPVSKPIVVYCRSGNRSGIAEKTLLKMGYTVHNAGGLNELLATRK
ncbi:rhodanese-like domain-containing protein [Ferrimonas lipolytica]|uniref:Rhodanese-like domain-containing protein n=1 Tax=Ferrimonas lipolytica TaxID=2724191 RepID=A0A6H1UEI6_9GAMM|nr:rhodanese-like domain-containing protein [Ferrimonas lipolytica]QIZ77238.1 rhodanese-like domain-containing protein [Ferrimonas lipolytica]